MQYVIAIDVGIRNLGICVFDFCSAKFIFWNNVPIVPNGRYIPSNNVKYVRDLLSRYESFFSNAHCVLVERQMRCNMRIIEAIIQTMFYDKCIVINPRSVKAHYSIGTKNYRMNKQKAVQWADRFITSNAAAFAPGVHETFLSNEKKDDFADALLMVTYYLDTYSNQLGSVNDLHSVSLDDE
jgi:hypothetical protein